MKPFDPAMFDEIPDVLQGEARAPALRSAVEELRVREKAPTRNETSRQNLIALGASAAWLVGLALVIGLRPGPSLFSFPYGVYCITPAVLGAVVLYFAVHPGRLGLGPRVVVAAGLSLLAPALFVLASAMSRRAPHDDFAYHAFLCGDWALFLGAVPLVASFFALRRAFTVSATWRFALLGVAVGLFAAAGIGMHCPNEDGLHVALGHAWPIPLLGLAAFALFRRRDLRKTDGAPPERS